MASLGNRIVVLIDMDCFFCQVETRLKPEYAGKPLAVVQYNLWRSGGIIAVNYEARDFGVTRHMRGDEAKEKCPDIILAIVPSLRGKADTSRYRSAGREVIEVLKKNCNLVERASVDEAYLDITQIIDDQISKGTEIDTSTLKQLETTYVVGHSECGVNDEEQRTEGLKTWLSESSEDPQIQRLALAGLFVENIRREVYETTGFRCSAGISFNKILAKLACGLHKPNRQTILPASSVPQLFGSLPVKKVKNLGGKFGDIVVDSLKCNVMGDLLPYSLQYLQNRFEEKTGLWLYNIARGIDNEPVTPRLVSKSIGACKRFPGKQAIIDNDTLKHWLSELSAEVCERLEQDIEENDRKATQLIISFHYYQNKKDVSQSKSIALTTYKQEKVAEQALNVVNKATQQLPVSFLGLSAGKFIQMKGSENFMNFFKTNTSTPITNTNEANTTTLSAYTNESDNVEDETNVKIEKVEKLHSTKKIPDTIHANNIPQDIKKVKSPFDKLKVKRRSSPCSKLQKSLQKDNFKKSFFMSIFKDNNQSEDDKKDDEESTGIKNEVDDDDDDDDGVTELEEHSSDESEDIFEENAKETNQEDTTTKELPQNRLCQNTNEAITKLQEIFPDLNDIDPEVVKLLPIQLQDEAKKFLKTKENREKLTNTERIKSKEKNTKDTNKIIKSKLPQTKTVTKKSNIQNFFIKTDMNNDTNNNFKKCNKCDQLILINKFNEHNDFHVAQNLQEEMNRLPVQNPQRETNNEHLQREIFDRLPCDDESRKRKVNLDSPKHVKKRLSDEFVTSTFFQR